MGKRLPPIATALVIAVGALVWFVPYATRSHQPVSSTGASPPFSNVTPVALPAGSVACMRNVTIDTNARLAQFVLIPGPEPSPPLRVSTDGPDGYHGRAVRIPGGHRTPTSQTAPIQPPTRAVIGQVCVRNVGRATVSLVGTTEKRTSGREQTVIDGRRVEPDVALELLQARTTTLLDETPEILRHMATFKGSFVSTGLLWLMLALVVVGIPALVIAAVTSAVSTDQRPRYGRRRGADPPSARR
jgi:hypothetical protein